MSLIAEAKEFATLKHAYQFRKFSGEKYIEHPKRVAQIIIKYKDSSQLDKLIAASLLHDVVEDTDTDIPTITNLFGDLVGQLVSEVTSIKGYKDKANYLSDKMVGMRSWSLTIKLADRLDNVSDLRHTSSMFRRNYILETRTIISNLILKRDYLTPTHLQIIHDILKEVNGAAKIDLL